MLWLALKIDTAENTKPYPKSTCGIETQEKMKVFKWTTESTTIPPSDHLLFLVQISRMQSKLILLTWAGFHADLQHIIVSWKRVWGHEMLLNDIGNSILYSVFLSILCFFSYTQSLTWSKKLISSPKSIMNSPEKQTISHHQRGLSISLFSLGFQMGVEPDFQFPSKSGSSEDHPP